MKNEKRIIGKDKYKKHIRNLFAKNLRRLRKDRNISQMELASIADLSQNFINEIEHEKKCPSIETLAKLGEALGVEPAAFFLSETLLKVSDAEMLKADLSNLITARVYESIDSYSIKSETK